MKGFGLSDRWKNISRRLFLTQHNLSFPMFVLNFIILCQAVPESKMKVKWINEVTDKQEMADSFLHNTTYHTISSSYVKQFLRNF